MTNQLKFSDCRVCRFRADPETCALCDIGEFFEPRSRAELSFEDDASIMSRRQAPSHHRSDKYVNQIIADLEQSDDNESYGDED